MTHLQHSHVRGFAVPIFAGNKVIAGLSIFLPEYRCSSTRQKDLVLAIREAAAAISNKLG